MASFYDLLQAPARETDPTGSYTYDVGEGPTTIQATPMVNATTPIPPGQASIPPWLQQMYSLAQTSARRPSQPAPSVSGGGGAGVAPLPPPLQPVPSEAGSAKGLISNSRQGIDIATVIKLASLFFGGGAAAGGAAAGAAEAAGAGAGAAGAAGGGGSFLSGLMGSMGGGGGGSGGSSGGPFGGSGATSRGMGGLGGLLSGYQGKSIPPPPLPAQGNVNTAPLIPRTNDYWRPDAPNTLFG